MGNDNNKTKARKKVIIHLSDPDASDAVKNDESTQLGIEVDKLYQQLLKLGQLLERDSLEALNIPPYLTKDHELKQLMEKYSHSYQEFNAITMDCQKKMAIQRAHVDYLDSLKKRFIEAHIKLPEINAQLIALYDQINKRQDMIAPGFSNNSELKDYLITSQQQLSAQLKFFAHQIAGIHLLAMDCPDSQFFQSELKTLCRTLDKLLDTKALAMDSKAKDILLEKMLNHIGVTTSIQSFIDYIKLEHNEVRLLTQSLFLDVPIADTNEINEVNLAQSFINTLSSKLNIKKQRTETEWLLRQIAATHHALSAIKELPFEAFCNYYSLKNNTLILEKNISLLKKDISITLNEWIKNIQNELLLFGTDYDDLPIIKRAAHLLEMLLNIQNKFIKLNELDFESLPPEATAEQRLALLEKKRKGLGDRFMELKNLGNEIPFQNHLLRTYEDLQQKYHNERLHLQSILGKELENARIALNLIGNSLHDYKLEEYKDLLKSSELKPLAVFNQTLSEILGYIEDVKSSLKKQKAPLNENIQRAHLQFQMPKLCEENPCKKDLQELHQHLHRDAAVLQSLIEALPELSGEKLPRWVRIFDHNYPIAAKLTTQRRQLFIKARELERRIDTPSYRTSLDILAALNKEIARITERHINEAMMRADSDTDIQGQLNTIIESDDFMLEGLYSSETLNSIDPRLAQLLELRRQFNALNAEYISLNLNLMDDAKFNKELKEKVNQELHHDHMEIYSDAKRIKLIQWIRKHVLKPIVALQYQAGAYLKWYPEENRHAFFVTPGASITERCIAETGHEAYTTLNIASPAA